MLILNLSYTVKPRNTASNELNRHGLDHTNVLILLTSLRQWPAAWCKVPPRRLFVKTFLSYRTRRFLRMLLARRSPSPLRGVEAQQEKDASRAAALAQIEQVRMLNSRNGPKAEHARGAAFEDAP